MVNFKRAHFEAAIVLTCVHRYVAYSLSYHQLQAGRRQPQQPLTGSECPTHFCVFQPATTALKWALLLISILTPFASTCPVGDCLLKSAKYFLCKALRLQGLEGMHLIFTA
jgi:hypothetical protein